MTPRENIHAFFEGRPYEWKPLSSDRITFHPEEISEYVARAFVFQQEPYTGPKGGKGWFNIEWEYEPGAGGSISLKPILEDVSEWKEKMEFPDLTKIDWEGIAKKNADYLKTDKAITFTIFTGYFERLISLLSFEEAAMELIMEDYEDDINELFTALTDFYIDFAQHFRKYFNADFVQIHDDWGTQRSAFFSPAVHKKMIIPHLTRFVSACHEMGLVVEMHSCGFIEELIPNLISTGMDTWPGQGLCDKYKLVQLYGDQFKFMVRVSMKDEKDITVERARQYALDIYNKFRDKDVFFMVYGRDCGGPENTDAICEVLLEEGKKQCAAA